MPSVIAVDFGGTKLTTAVVDQDGSLTGRTKRPVAHTGLSDSVKQIQLAIRESVDASQDTDIQAVGLIVPGIFDAGTGKAWSRDGRAGGTQVRCNLECRRVLEARCY